MIAAMEETGSLGVPHLKRFWSRILARARSDEWAEDHVLLSGLQAGTRETLAYLHECRPTFAEFEAWILERNDGAVDGAVVARINAAVTGTLEAGAPVGGPLSQDELEGWERDGYVVLRDAVSPKQCGAAADAIYEYLGADPNDPETWYRNPNGHSIWVSLLRHPAFRANRESARIQAAFGQLWGRTDLWASVDQGGFNPPERPGWPFPGPHLHWDVSLAHPMPFGVQGILYLTDTAADQGAFQCVPGFHRRLASWSPSCRRGAIRATGGWWMSWGRSRSRGARGIW